MLNMKYNACPKEKTNRERRNIFIINYKGKVWSFAVISSRYNNLNEGKAIAINIKAGVIVHISSIKVDP